MHRLSAACGEECTEDGIHYSEATFDGSLQQWAAAMWTLELERGWCGPESEHAASPRAAGGRHASRRQAGSVSRRVRALWRQLAQRGPGSGCSLPSERADGDGDS